MQGRKDSDSPEFGQQKNFLEVTQLTPLLPGRFQLTDLHRGDFPTEAGSKWDGL